MKTMEINGKTYEAFLVEGDRHYYVNILCAYCGKPSIKRAVRVKAGIGLYCNVQCANKGRTEGKERKYTGKENGKVVFDKSRNMYYVYWFEGPEKKRCTTSYARWWWETHNGPIPEGSRASYKDGNPMNISDENICLHSAEEFGKAISERLMGHDFSEETLQKMSEAKKDKPLPEEHKKNIAMSVIRRWEDGRYDSVHKGENNHFWKGGVFDPYPPEFNNELRKVILSRDKYKCRICSSKKGNMSIHHLDGDKQNSSEENLITLCNMCHSKVHHPNPKENDPVILAFQSKLNL